MTEQEQEIARLRQWVADLQSGMYVNCVYCGHNYGPKDKVPCTMADALKQHVEQCPEHPLSKLRAATMQVLRDVGGFIAAADKLYLWDKKFPRGLMLQMGESGRKCREFLGPHHLADLTNDPTVAAVIRKALAPVDNAAEIEELLR